jgi:hypothetical protein
MLRGSCLAEGAGLALKCHARFFWEYRAHAEYLRREGDTVRLAYFLSVSKFPQQTRTFSP